MLADWGYAGRLQPLVAALDRVANRRARLERVELSVQDAVAVEVDLLAVGALDETEVALGEQPCDPPMRRRGVRLHFAATLGGMAVELPSGGAKGVADGGRQIFVRVIVVGVAADDDLAAGDVDVEPDVKNAAFGVLAVGRLDDHPTVDDTAEHPFELGHFPVHAGFGLGRVFEVTKRYRWCGLHCSATPLPSNRDRTYSTIGDSDGQAMIAGCRAPPEGAPTRYTLFLSSLANPAELSIVVANARQRRYPVRGTGFATVEGGGEKGGRMDTDTEFAGRVALVTGGTRGIGRAVSVDLARRGARIAMNYAENAAAASEARSLVEATGVACLPIKTDVSDPDAVAAMVASVERELGAVDLLVTCAAIVREQVHTEMDLETWHRTLAVNVDGTYHPVMAVKDGMIARGYGRIVCISSIAAIRPRPTVIAYSASKAAIIAFVRSCGVAFAPAVRVNCVAPGFVDTEILDFMDEAARQEVIDATPLKRLGKPEEIAEMVAFLLSDRSSFTTAQTVLASGGQATVP